MKHSHSLKAVAAALALGTGILTLSLALAPAEAAGPEAKPSAAASIERGRYIAKVAGCNECHTPGYAMTGGAVPEKNWLTGDGLGWQGPWGTTYPANLRLILSQMTEDEWVKTAKSLRTRPPMMCRHEWQDAVYAHNRITLITMITVPSPMPNPPSAPWNARIAS